MLSATVYLVSILTTGSVAVQPRAPVERWVGQTRVQIEKGLGEGPTAFTFGGGTANLEVSCVYANARLIIRYKNGVAVNVSRAD